MYSKQTIQVCGGVTADLEEKVFGENTLYTFSVAVTEYRGEGKEDRVEYFDCFTWNPSEAFLKRLMRHVKKGANVDVSLTKETSTKDGKRYTRFRVKAIDLIAPPRGERQESRLATEDNPFPAP